MPKTRINTVWPIRRVKLLHSQHDVSLKPRRYPGRVHAGQNCDLVYFVHSSSSSTSASGRQSKTIMQSNVERWQRSSDTDSELERGSAGSKKTGESEK